MGYIFICVICKGGAMIRLKESIHIKKNIKTVFDYVSDFSHIQDWDPGVVLSRKSQPDDTGVGSTYDLILKFGMFRPEMKYTITAYEPFSRVVLNGQGESFSVTDTIGFKKTAIGTQIDYQADILFSGSGRYMETCLSPVLKQMGRKSMLGLEQKLDGPRGLTDGSGWFRSGTSVLDYLADHAILPGMLMFSRYGYELSKRFWTEPGDTLYGKKVVLTGGTSGIGKAAALKLAEKKAFLTIVARNREKAEQVQKEIIERTGNPQVDVMIADLSLMGDIKHLADQLQDTKKSIDILINNAGALFNERKQTQDGIEQTFATDLLGVFYLTMRLKDALARSRNARIINVSSGGMYTQKIDVADLENRQGPYNGATAYARAKEALSS